MHHAAWDGQVAAIKALKELGADVSVKNDRGLTPFGMATLYGHTDAAKLLKKLEGTS